MQSFNVRKKHNRVEIAINYRNGNNRNEIEHEIALLNELNTLMASCANIHRHGNDPIVRPNIISIDHDTYTGSIDLKFDITPLVESEDHGLVSYSYAGLHAILSHIAVICARHRDNFEAFSTYLNLESMRTPWVLPVAGAGVILREGAMQKQLFGRDLPHSAKLGHQHYAVEQMFVVGEPNACNQFLALWRNACKLYRNVMDQYEGHPNFNRGPEIDLNGLKLCAPKLRWNNVGVFVMVRDAVDQLHIEQLGNMHNGTSEQYILNLGNHMMNTPLPFDELSGGENEGVFLPEHSYYSFESVV